MTTPYCAYCDKPNIDLDVEACLGVKGYRVLADEYLGQKDSIQRHVPHIKWNAEMRERAAKLVTRQPLSVRALRLDRLEGVEPPTLEAVLQRLLELELLAQDTLLALHQRGDMRQADSTIRTVESIIKTISQLSGLLKDGPTIVVLSQSPEFLALQYRLVQSLEPWPDAALAVANALAIEPVIEV